MKKQEIVKQLINLFMMLLAVVLINIFFEKDLGDWRYIGLIGFAILGLYWDKDLGVRK